MTSMNEQRPTVEADSLVQSWQNRNNYPDARYLGQLKEAIATALAARDAEITQEKERTSKVWAIHADSIAKSVVRESKLQAENQRQRALLADACGIIPTLMDSAYWRNYDSHPVMVKAKQWLSNPAVVELLKPQSVWVPTVQCNGAMACVTIPNRVTTLKFDTEAECQTWCDKSNETAKALWVPVEHKELLKESQKGFVNAPTTDDLRPTEAEKAKFAQLHQWQKDSSKTAAVELMKGAS